MVKSLGLSGRATEVCGSFLTGTCNLFLCPTLVTRQKTSFSKCVSVELRIADDFKIWYW